MASRRKEASHFQEPREIDFLIILVGWEVECQERRFRNQTKSPKACLLTGEKKLAASVSLPNLSEPWMLHLLASTKKFGTVFGHWMQKNTQDAKFCWKKDYRSWHCSCLRQVFSGEAKDPPFGGVLCLFVRWAIDLSSGKPHLPITRCTSQELSGVWSLLRFPYFCCSFLILYCFLFFDGKRHAACIQLCSKYQTAGLYRLFTRLSLLCYWLDNVTLSFKQLAETSM